MARRPTKYIGAINVTDDFQLNGTSVFNSLSAYGAVASDRVVKVGVKALTGAAIHAGVVAWQNPESVAIVITRLVIDRTTKSTAASSLDIGTTATSATTASDNLIDGLVSSGTEAVEDNLQNPGTNGKQLQKLAAAKWVTFKEASGDMTGLVANAYVFYTLV
jgi:hypothetical protein